MKRLASLLVVLVCAFSGYSQTAGKKRLAAGARPPAKVDAKPQAPARTNSVNSLPIRRVILYSNGVAYIERRGMVSGNAEINLSFKQSQVDDVLKSMVVLDLNQGKKDRRRQLQLVGAGIGTNVGDPLLCKRCLFRRFGNRGRTGAASRSQGVGRDNEGRVYRIRSNRRAKNCPEREGDDNYKCRGNRER